MAKSQYHIKVADLQESPAKATAAKEMLIVRAIRTRRGTAGRAQKWECDLIDDARAESVLLADAWGANIALAERKLKNDTVYKITKYVVLNKGKSIPYGNNCIKITITPDVVIEELEDQYSEIPTELPTEALSDVVGVAAPRLTSLILAVDKPGVKKAQTIKKSGLTRDVTNVTMKAQSHKIEFAAWGLLAEQIANETGYFRLDAVLVNPAVGGDSVKISTLDCSSVRRPTEEESEALKENLAPDDRLVSLTTQSFVSKRSTEMSKSVSVTNFELLAIMLAAQYDAMNGAGRIEATVEVPSVMITNISGPDYADASELRYRGCPKCMFKRMGEDGTCVKCGGSEYESRCLLHVTMSDPTASLEGIMHHESAEEFLDDEELQQKPVVALVHIGPDSYKAGKHAMEVYAFKPMFSKGGVLNVFRAPPSRFHTSGDKVIPTMPGEVTTNSMSQTVVYNTFCSHVRLLLRITGDKPSTDVQEDVDGMRCEQKGQCCISHADVALVQTGSFDTVAPLFRLRKRDMVHVICSLTARTEKSSAATFKPLKIYTFQEEDQDTVAKAFKYEVEQVRRHFQKVPEAIPDTEETPDIKRKIEANQTRSSPGWSSPQRRLKLRKTTDASDVGVQ